jgi:S-ribosylhomocysteine lyase LuxS involved in autoinducer biosynthesis
MGKTCSACGKRRGVYMVLVGKPEGKETTGESRSRWEDNIKMELLEVTCGGMDWIKLAEDRDRWRTLVNAVINILVP